MKMRPAREGSRGASLLLSLFATTVLLALGVAFFSLAVVENRAARHSQYETFAERVTQMTQGHLIAYMGIPEAWSAFDDNGVSSYRLATQTGTAFGGRWVEVLSRAAGEPPPGELGDLSKFDDGDIRYIRIRRLNQAGTGPDPNQPNRLDRELGVEAREEAWLFILRSSKEQLPEFQPDQYVLVTRATVTPIGSQERLSQKTLVARFRESTASDYVLFQQNMLSWDEPGYGAAHDDRTEKVSIPRGFRAVGRVRVDGMNSGQAADKVVAASGILQFEGGGPNDFTFERQVTWQSQPGDPTQPKQHRPSGVNANLDGYFPNGYAFFPPLGLPDARGYLAQYTAYDTTIHGTALAAAQSGSVSGAILLGDPPVKPSEVTGTISAGTPDGRVGVRVKASDGKYYIGPADQPWSGSTPPPSWHREDASDKTFYDVGFDWPFSTYQPSSQKVQDVVGQGGTLSHDSDLLYRTRPRFAKIVVQVEGDKVRIRKFDAFADYKHTNPDKGDDSPSSVTSYFAKPFREDTSFALSGATSQATRITGIPLKDLSGTLYVEGGDVLVEAPRGIDGNLTVVVAESRQRRLLRHPRSGSDVNHRAAKDSIYIHPDTFGAALTDTTVRNRIGQWDASKSRFTRLNHPPWNIGTPSKPKWVWPMPKGRFFDVDGDGVESANDLFRVGTDPQHEPQTDPKTQGFDARYKEGNLFITDHIRYQETGTLSSVGLIAENWVFLPDAAAYKNSPKGLELRGMIFSFDHSVQYDWENLRELRKKPNAAQELDKRKDVRLSFKGSNVGKFADVSGIAGSKHGYYRQVYEHDSDLRNQQPPSMPRWGRLDHLNRPVEFVLLSQQDLASLGAKDQR